MAYVDPKRSYHAFLHDFIYPNVYLLPPFKIAMKNPIANQNINYNQNFEYLSLKNKSIQPF